MSEMKTFHLSPIPSAFADDPTSTPNFGYITQPDIHDSAIAFVADGDLFYARLDGDTAMRLTGTAGNVNSPKINPDFPYLIAFTATYHARRDVYLVDLRKIRPGNAPPVQRLTYFDSRYGVSRVVAWNDTSLLFAAQSNQVGLPDTRLYEIKLQKGAGETSAVQVLQTVPVPLAQATQGVPFQGCLYFVRYKQSSWTARYVGGTAESLWAYCDGEETAIPLTSDYNGTSTSPRIVNAKNQPYLAYLSDRSPSKEGGWRATSLNLWVAPLPTRVDLYGSQKYNGLSGMVQLTKASCQFNGMDLREFAVDKKTNDIVLRIGADLYRLGADEVSATLEQSGNIAQPSLIPLQLMSDFHEQQERILKVDVNVHMTSADVFETDFEMTNTLLTLRGQLWVAPVLDYNLDDAQEYHGGGQNIPARRYRVIPGAMTGGAIRVLVACHIPLHSKASDEDTSRRLALVLATDPHSATGEHAFYIVEVQASHTNQFASLTHFPKPFLGGSVNGGSVEEGGLGSIDAGSVVVSPCGRRFAWTDTDDRICVMTTPIYASHVAGKMSSFHCLPSTNEQGEPLSGTTAVLSWSPGGRYLGIVHKALNQFKVISIADCGRPLENDSTVRDISIGTIRQVTPSRFNSNGMFWGKSPFDIYLKKTLGDLSETVETKETATTLYFVTDRDVVTDVTSPWGSRAPLPHFPKNEGT